VSVTPLRFLVVLWKSSGQNSSEGVSTANHDLDEKEVADLERYLDVTRGELLFARGVLLVEGDAELFLVPVLWKLNNFDFDDLGITVCSVSGTNFLPYIKFLGSTGLDIPYGWRCPACRR
jgi:putative ATP-dependent endonuclease of OLD family